ncbi:MAG: glycoside hydrolase family 3 N-terminal domain-containing protein [Myxococcota bacterium]
MTSSAALLLFVVSATDGGVSDSPEPAAPPAAVRRIVRKPLARPVDEARVERVLASMDTRARAAQLILAYPQIGKSTPVEVGGVLFVGNSLKNLAKAKERVDSSLARARIPPFFAVDMEGGPSNRMKGVRGLKDLPSAREMAALDDADVRRWGRKVGEAMQALGLNMNLAPVLDVSASGHMERNGRSFSGEPDVVVQKATAFSRGLLEAGVVPIGKHFPGYGNTDGDSDHALVTSDLPKPLVLNQIDVFHRAREVLGGVMLANVAYASINPKPAILSPELVALAHERDWIAVTDDLSIQVLADAVGGTTEEVLRQAFLAGNDLLLTTAPPDWDKGVDVIGVLTEFAEADPKAKALLETSCRRVLRLKDRMGLLDGL